MLKCSFFFLSQAWSAYSYYVGDLFIGVPNYLGVGLAVAQVSLFVAYRPGGPLSSSHGYSPIGKVGDAVV